MTPVTPYRDSGTRFTTLRVKDGPGSVNLIKPCNDSDREYYTLRGEKGLDIGVFSLKQENVPGIGSTIVRRRNQDVSFLYYCITYTDPGRGNTTLRGRTQTRSLP